MRKFEADNPLMTSVSTLLVVWVIKSSSRSQKMYESFSTVESIVALLECFPHDFVVGVEIDGKLHDFDIMFDPDNRAVKLVNLE